MTGVGRTLVSATELGVLQTARDWASVTARIAPRQAGADAGFVTVIVERADPFVGVAGVVRRRRLFPPTGLIE